MAINEHSVYVDSRPLRVAFLVSNVPNRLSEIDDVIEYCLGKWGGRFCPIIDTSGDSIPDDWWVYLEGYDPDVVKSLVPLSQDFVNQISVRLSAYSVEVHHEPVPDFSDRANRWQIEPHDKAISIVPCKLAVQPLLNDPFNPHELIVVNLSQDVEPLVKGFVARNFGLLDRTYSTERGLAEIPFQRVDIAGRQSLADLLVQLSAFRPVLHPIQLCATAGIRREGDSIQSPDLVVHIGNSTADVLGHWNAVNSFPSWRRRRICTAWIPPEFLADDTLLPAIGQWLNRLADPSGQTNKTMVLYSASLEQTQLESSAAVLSTAGGCPATASPVNNLPAPRFVPGIDLNHRLGEMELHRCSGDIGQLVLSEPAVPEGSLCGENWMADVYIEFHPDRYSTFHGRTLWWQLPRFTNLPRHMFQGTGRSLTTRYPSVLMTRGKPRLTVLLPRDEDFCQSIFFDVGRPAYTSDARKSISRGRLANTRVSRDGNSLTGILGLFGGLHEAYGIVRDPVWRDILDEFTHRERRNDEIALAKISKQIKQYPINCGISKNDAGTARKLLDLSKGVASCVDELEFGRMVEIASSYWKTNQNHSGRLDDERLNELKSDLNDLIERNVVLPGTHLRCKTCGREEWYSVDQLAATLTCSGCRGKVPFRAESKWQYRINSLLHDSWIGGGIAPVVLALGRLWMESSTSFIMNPCLDVYKNADERWTDIDILCVQDGKLVIGEAKQTNRNFNSDQFDKMAELAELVLADKVIFTSMETEPDKQTVENMDRIRERLRPNKTEVTWYPIVFEEPGRIRM